MPVEIGLWRVDGPPQRLSPAAVPLESQLETLIDTDPSVLGTPLLIVGRQVPTDFGGFIDLLGIDSDGAVHVLELKRDRTPREVVAQALDYGSWVQSLGNEEIRDIFARYRPSAVFDEEFAKLFGGAAPPDEINEEHHLTVIASQLDSATERIVRYLSDRGIPVNVMFFKYFVDEGRSYFARTWLVEESRVATAPKARRSGTKEPWNGLDWYVSFGEESGIRDWDDARRYGFVSAGGGAWFSRTLRAVPVGARIWTYIPKSGYVGVGEVTGEAMPAEEAVLSVDGEQRPMRDLDLKAQYRHAGADGDRERAEYVLPVRWLTTVDRENALSRTGFFANQNSACKLRNRFTLDELTKHFGVEG